MPGIHPDTRRQAVASLGGYAYQIWHSVLAWLDLRDHQAIDLEGNEDIDLLFPGGAISTQVKALRDPITLRSADAVETINNCWTAQERNPGLPLTLRFLSTAGSTFEKERPFDDRHGLQVWRQLQRPIRTETTAADMAKLRSFLLTLSGLDAGLKRWLESATDDEIVTRLIRPLVWDIDADGSETIKALIDERLALLGEPFGIYPADAAKVRPALLQEVLTRATSQKAEDRRLKRFDLLKLFETATSITVPRNSLVAAQAAMSAPFTITLSATAAEGQRIVAALQRITLTSATELLIRHGAVGTILTAANRHGLVYVGGSTGMGKSTLVQQAVSGMSTEPIWLDFRDVQQDASRLLRQIASAVNIEGMKVNLVLDDLNFTGDSRSLQAALESLLTAVSTRGGLLFITGTKAPPASWLLKLGCDSTAAIEAPRFEESEVEQLLILKGMSPGQHCAAWSKLISAHTSGHPQLVRARVETLKNRGFPQICEKDLLPGASDLQEVRQQARSIISELPQADRELLYRLSLTIGRLKRSAILKIGNLQPTIPEPGNVLDRLAGPWIEKLSDEAYRVSPLVQGAGVAVHGESWSGPVHRAIGRSLLSPVLAPDDASAILAHAIAGNDELLLAKMCMVLLSVEGKKIVYEWLGWFLCLETKSFRVWHTRVMVRLLQFKIAAETEPSKVLEHANKLEEESRVTKNSEVAHRYTRYVAAATLLITISARLPARMIVSSAIEADGLSKYRHELLEQNRDTTGDGDASIDLANEEKETVDLEIGMTVVAATQGRIATHLDLKEFLEELDKLPTEQRDRLISKLGHDSFAATHVVNATWLHEWRAEKPEWMPFIRTLKECLDIVLRWQANALAAAICTAMVRTTNENLGQPLDARRLGDSFVKIVGEAPELIDAIADTFDAEGDSTQALELRERVLPQWVPTENDVLGPIIARRKAAISAASANRWSTAAVLLRQAATFTRADNHVLHVGLLFDAAYADLKAGNTSISIERFLDAIDLLKAVPNTPDDPVAFRLHKVVGNMLTVMAGGDEAREPGTELAEITPACCSDFFVHDELTKLNLTPVEFSTLNLCRYAVRAGAASPRIIETLAGYRESKVTLLRLLASNAEATHALLTTDLDQIPARALASSRVLAQAMKAGRGADVMAESAPASERDPGDLFFVRTYLISALLVSVESGAVLSIPSSWRAQLAFPALPVEAQPWLDHLQGLLASPLTQRIARVSNYGDVHELGALELSIATDPAAPMKVVLRSHVHLLNMVQQKALLPEIAPHFSRLISRFWAEQAQHGFALTNPRITQPALRDACALAEETLSKAAGILLAASEAVGASLPIEVANSLLAARASPEVKA